MGQNQSSIAGQQQQLEQRTNGQERAGTSRFMRVLIDDGGQKRLVVKQITRQSPNEDALFQQAVAQMLRIRQKCARTRHQLPYQVLMVDGHELMLDNSAPLGSHYRMERQLINQSLYDRISTRPFLSQHQKLWLIYQLLQAVDEMHRLDVIHGDLKAENVVVTTAGWLFIVDYAPFKPQRLPADDPADFAYFFDSSLRRSCYLAPERFSQHVPITNKIDVFSLACVIWELWMDGQEAFTLSSLLQYVKSGELPPVMLASIDNDHLRLMLQHMLVADPAQRPSASQCLNENKTMFARCFDAFLYAYIAQLDDFDVENDAERTINTLHRDFARIAHELHLPVSSTFVSEPSDLRLTVPGYSQSLPKDCTVAPEATIVLNVVTSCVRNVKTVEAKMRALELLLILGHYVAVEDLCDIVVPYLVNAFCDPQASVKCYALRALVKLLTTVHRVPPGDIDVMVEFVWPQIRTLVTSGGSLVLCTLVPLMQQLVDVSLDILDSNYSSVTNVLDNDLESPADNAATYDAKRDELILVAEQLTVALLVSRDAEVRLAILTHLGPLCRVLGQRVMCDTVLSHVITYLNDSNVYVRAAFFAAMPEVGKCIGPHAVQEFIWPLIQQSVKKMDERVLQSVIRCIAELLELVPKMQIVKILHTVCPLLLHYSTALRYAVMRLLVAVRDYMSEVDWEVFVAGKIPRPYLQHELVHKFKVADLNEVLSPPLSAQLYKIVCWTLQGTKQRGDDLHRNNSLIASALFSVPDLDKVLARHMLSDEDMHKIRLLAPYMWNDTVQSEVEDQGTVKVSTIQANARTVFLTPPAPTPKLPRSQSVHVIRETQPVDQSDAASVSSTFTQNQSAIMFNTAQSRATASLAVTNVTVTAEPQMLSVGSPPYHHSSSLRTAMSEAALSGRTTPIPEYVPPPAHTEFPQLQSLLADKSIDAFPHHVVNIKAPVAVYQSQQQLATGRTSKRTASNANGTASWKPDGVLLANLQEHTKSVTKLALSPDQRFFVSASADGTLKVWDCEYMDTNVANASRLTYTAGHPLTDTFFCNGTHTVATVSHSGIDFVDIEYASGTSSSRSQYRRATPIHRTACGADNNHIYQATPTNAGATQLAIATGRHEVYGWDIRADKKTWQFDYPLAYGAVSAMTSDSLDGSWLTLGTHEGVLSCWDLRFIVPCKSWQHPSRQRIHKLHAYQSLSANRCKRVFCAAGNNELALWDLQKGEYREIFSAAADTKSQRMVKRSLPAPSGIPTTNRHPLPHQPSFRTFWYRSDCNFIVTAGTDQRIRYWDLAHIDRSYQVSAGSSSHSVRDKLEYTSTKQDGVIVHQERQLKSALKNAPAQHARSAAKVIANRQDDDDDNNNVLPRQLSSHHESDYTHHTTAITDVLVAEYPHRRLISAGADGIIKVWK